MKILLDDVYKKIITFLNKKKYEYLVIGGIAAGTLGEPRLTGDIDIDILLSKKDSEHFLSELAKEKFVIDKIKCRQSIKNTGTFKIYFSDFHIDFIICSTELENSAFKRSTIISLYGISAPFPTPEDIILLKIIPGRSQDLLDIEKIIVRHKGKLDTAYILSWAQKLSDEAEDMRYYNRLKKIL